MTIKIVYYKINSKYQPRDKKIKIKYKIPKKKIIMNNLNKSIIIQVLKTQKVEIKVISKIKHKLKNQIIMVNKVFKKAKHKLDFKSLIKINKVS